MRLSVSSSREPLLCVVDGGVPDAHRRQLRDTADRIGGIEVRTERRRSDRRARRRLREEALTLIPTAELDGADGDRRMRERRVEVRKADPPPELRVLAAKYPRGLRFVRPLALTPDDAAVNHLIERIQAGDDEALDELYKLYLAPLYGYMVVALRDHHAAEDAAHEVFVRVLRALPRYQQRGVPFRIWLFRIARNHLLNLKTRSKPEDSEDPSVLQRRVDRQPAEEGDLELAAFSDAEFLRLVQILPFGQRQVLVLRYVFDMSFDEIGVVLGMTAPAARNQQRRAFAALRPRLLATRRSQSSASYSAMSMLARESVVFLSRSAPLPAFRM